MKIGGRIGIGLDWAGLGWIGLGTAEVVVPVDGTVGGTVGDF